MAVSYTHLFVTDSLCLDKPESVDDLKQSGVAFGMFPTQLADFPAHTLTETIPPFHATPARYEQLKQAVQENRAGRVDPVSYTHLDVYKRQQSPSPKRWRDGGKCDRKRRA